MAESDLRAVLQALSGRSFGAELDAWVHSTTELPLAELLAAHGVGVQPETVQPAQRLGLRVTESHAASHAVHIKTVLRGGLAERAGMAAGDEWLGIEVDGQGWRINKLEQLALLAGNAAEVTALISRDGRLLRLPLSLSAPADAASDTVALYLTDAGAVQRWL